MSVTTIDSMMNSVADCLAADSLQALVALKASDQQIERIQWLADKANEGQLSSADRGEYQCCILFANFVGILQSKAAHRLELRRENLSDR